MERSGRLDHFATFFGGAARRVSNMDDVGDVGTTVDRRLWTVRATVDDVPGRLAILAASLARRAVNILSVQVYLTADGPVDEMLVSTGPQLTATDLAAAAIEGGARTPTVCPADAHALVDAPTRALALATRLVRSPDDLAAVVASLLPGAQLVWRAEPPAGQRDSATRLWLTDPAGGGFLLTRPEAPFTPAERARAFAMVDVAVTAAMVGQASPPLTSEQCRLVLADGTEITVRTPGPDDRTAVCDLHVRNRSGAGLRRLLSADVGHALVAEDADGHVIAAANLVWRADAAEMTLLVDEDWRRRRIGTLLARRLLAVALEAGASRVRCTVHTGNTPAVRIMSALADRLHREYDEGRLTLIGTVVPPKPVPPKPVPPAHRQRSPSSNRLAHS